MKRWIGFLVVLFVGAWASQAFAESTRAEARGVRLPVSSFAASDGVFGMDQNPASIGFLRGHEFALSFSKYRKDELIGAQGALAFNGLSLGFSSRTNWNENSRLGGVLALGGPAASLGINFYGLLAGDDPSIDGTFGLDLGMILRPIWWFSGGLTIHDVNTPSIGGEELPRVYTAAAAFRLGTRRLTLELNSSVTELDWERSRLGGYLWATPLDGWHLGTQVAQVEEEGHEGLEVSAVLGLDWGLLGLYGGAHASTGVDGRSDGLDGGTFAVRFSGSPRTRLSRPEGVWTSLRLGSLSERSTSSIFNPGRRTLVRVIRYLEAIGKDDAVEGVVVNLSGYRGSWGQAREVRDLLDRLQSRGKKVVAYLTEASTKAYYVASTADKIYVNPAGGVWLIGVSSNVLFYKDLLDKVGVEGQAVRIGRYKSFPESFSRTTASEELDEVKNALLDGIYNEVVEAIAQGRGVELAEAKNLLEGGPYTAKELVEKGLADDTAHQDQLTKRIGKWMGRKLTFAKKFMPYRPAAEEWGKKDRVAVISITGPIVSGRSGAAPFVGYRSGARTVSKMLSAVVKAPEVKAIVLRIDTPGGSALGSDELYRKVRKAAAKKPIIISMGGVAASGGYFIAAAGDVIYADPTTVTGSIGIFTTKFSFKGLFEWAGLKQQIWKRGVNADLFEPSIAWTDDQQKIIEEKLEYFYERFLRAVATGRDMTRDEVHEIAQGRVWLGTQAKEIGLIDEFGGLDVAVEEAAKRGGITREYTVLHLPRQDWKAALRELLTPSLPSVMSAEDYDEMDVWVHEEDDAEEEVSASSVEALFGVLPRSWATLAQLSVFHAGEPLFMLPFSLYLEDMNQ